MRRIDILIASLLLLITVGCSETGEVTIYPDYRNVVVPCNIAPLNFHYSGKGTLTAVTTFSAGDLEFKVRGHEVRISQEQWNVLTEAAKGGTISVKSSVTDEQWSIYVSADTIDRYLTYRLIEPGYEVWDRVEIEERDITSFETRTLSSWKNTGNSCMNCHIHKGNATMFYLRGAKGGAILSRNGQVRKLNLRRDGMVSGTVYGDLHPSGRWGVFSTNVIIPSFHTLPGKRLEVYDTVSDLCIVDFDGNRIAVPDFLARADKLETFPCFSADGSEIFYCSADTVSLPGEIESLRYNLNKTSFDCSTGEAGPQTEVIWSASANGGSVCHPKASPDGKWLAFTVADYGTFPIWHRECDIHLMNLATGEINKMEEANSSFSDTYHSWSRNSRWMIFASKRDDGQYGRPYICHIGEDGTVSKAFVLPQEDPHLYEKSLKSYNIPDLGISPAAYDCEMIADIRNNTETEQFK